MQSRLGAGWSRLPGRCAMHSAQCERAAQTLEEFCCRLTTYLPRIEPFMADQNTPAVFRSQHQFSRERLGAIGICHGRVFAPLERMLRSGEPSGAPGLR